MTTTIKKGDLVHFGRSHGEKTLGRVLRVSPKSVTVEQLEARGTMRSYRIGTKWRVAPAFVSPAPAGSMVEPDEAPTHKRPEALVLRDISNVYCQLSPENLWQDGEATRSQAHAQAANLNRKLRALFRELGRPVSEELLPLAIA